MSRRVFPFALLTALAGLALLSPGPATGAAGPGSPAAKAKARPKIEVVFCLDTTGSMTGLIDGAKAKIWAICNQIAGGKPTPDLKVGLVAYRDRGDAYVTKVFDLTDDLDAVHSNLKGFKAEGGGDIPESVNQALYDSVHKVKWSTDRKTLRIIFLVGDAPPHMDYPDDVKYPITCTKACEKGIIINTIQCGTDAECAKYWKDICKKAEGSYVQISQGGGVVAVTTPFDAELAKINTEMVNATLVYGGAAMRRDGAEKLREARALPAPAAADRAGFGGWTGRAASYDLLDAIKDKRVKLEDIKDADLPAELKKLKTPAERKAYLDKVEKHRASLSKKAVELNKKRADYIARELAKKGKGKDAFDNQVLEMLRKQAKKHGVDY
jgi:Mg-chelatase subunit ChlD